MAKLKHITDHTLADAVKKSTSISSLARILGLKGGGSLHVLKERIKDLDTSHFTGQAWNRGKTAATHDSLKKSGETYVKNLKSGKFIPSFLGKKLSKEHREKISSSHSDRSNLNGLVKTKWYSIHCPHMNLTVNVQGTWEYAYATWLNENQIPWRKDRNISFKWKRDDDDISHVYYPDFYLPSTDEYIEIKGFMWKDSSRGIDDERKLEDVRRCNPNIKLIVLMKKDLLSLGIKVK